MTEVGTRDILPLNWDVLGRDNISALVMALTVAVVFVIVGFTIYFNNTGLNQAWSVQQQDFNSIRSLLVNQ
jgi:hypothetical protein